MDRYLAMTCFCKVVETGTLAGAGRALDLSPSVVTKYMQQLESWTSSRLLARTTRALQLTEAGEQFHAYCLRVLADTDQTLGLLREQRGEPAGRLVVFAPVSLTLSVLAPHLHVFQQQHAAITLELRLDDRAVNLVRDGVDVALRGQAQLEDSSLVATRLMELPRVVCAAPSYWRTHGLPQAPEALQQHDCFDYLLGSDAGHWRFECDGGRSQTVVVRGSLRSDNTLLLIDAMLRGRGVGLVPRPMVADALADGRLEPALQDWRAAPRQLFAVYASRAHLPGKVQAFIAFLRTRLGTDQAGTTAPR
ncbi:LysR family transcriptional regulator [Comamonadaceae bacterium G21597-S1]|nr:LysR family transcriptional regulator [Comamonadaceae bacterium G21597-S1]